MGPGPALDLRDGEQGLVKAHSGAYDLIILDVMLPRRDGWSILRELRRLGKHTPVLFLTALVSEAEAPSGSYSSGGHTFLPKSLPLVKLMECITQALAARQPAAVAV